MNIKDKILNMPKEKREERMRLFITFSMPALFSVLYDLIRTYLLQSPYLTILWTIMFSIVWAIFARRIGKSGVEFKKAFLCVHSFMILGAFFSVISVLLMPKTPEFLKALAVMFNYYMLTVEGFSVAALGHLARVVETYYLYIPLFPIVGAIWLMAVFIVAYRDKQ